MIKSSSPCTESPPCGSPLAASFWPWSSPSCTPRSDSGSRTEGRRRCSAGKGLPSPPDAAPPSCAPTAPWRTRSGLSAHKLDGAGFNRMFGTLQGVSLGHEPGLSGLRLGEFRELESHYSKKLLLRVEKWNLLNLSQPNLVHDQRRHPV